MIEVSGAGHVFDIGNGKTLAAELLDIAKHPGKIDLWRVVA